MISRSFGPVRERALGGSQRIFQTGDADGILEGVVFAFG